MGTAIPPARTWSWWYHHVWLERHRHHVLHIMVHPEIDVFDLPRRDDDQVVSRQGDIRAIFGCVSALLRFKISLWGMPRASRRTSTTFLILAYSPRPPAVLIAWSAVMPGRGGNAPGWATSPPT